MDQAEIARLKPLYRRPAETPFPAANPYSDARARLGRALFFDPILSGNNSYACATCHIPARGWSDGRPRAVGENGAVLARRTPTLLNLAWDELFFWDGRAVSLEDQALEPPKAVDEMNQPMDALIGELAAVPAYPPLFAAAFPENPAISSANIVAALATYERTLVSPEAPFDRWIAGDEDAIDAAAKRGFLLFNGAANCNACHKGWAFTDGAFHDIGLPGNDRGRGATLGLPALDHAFKTPTLRDVTKRSPYMHDGSLATLDAVIDHYVDGIVQRPTLSDDLMPIALTASERADLLAFLETLASDRSADRLGDTPPPISPRPISPSRPSPAVAAREVPPLHGFSEAARADTSRASTVEVSQKDREFRPGRIALAPGGTLVIHNDDERKHNVRISNPAMNVNSGIQEPGETVTIRFPEAGRFDAFCGIHPKMKLTVEVGD